MPRQELSADEIKSLLTELGHRLQDKDVEATIYIIGGAAIALEMDTRRVTANIDAIFHPETTVAKIVVA
jgi:methylmalonyl-CoA mutase cobalamin-binding subunit